MSIISKNWKYNFNVAGQHDIVVAGTGNNIKIFSIIIANNSAFSTYFYLRIYGPSGNYALLYNKTLLSGKNFIIDAKLFLNDGDSLSIETTSSALISVVVSGTQG